MKKAPEFREIMPENVWQWNYMNSQLELVLSLFNYREIRLSVLQDSEMLYKGITSLPESDETDAFSTRLVTVNGENGEHHALSLRPEGTIKVLNHAAHELQSGKTHRIYYKGHMFRKDAEGKPLEFSQLGVELLGSDSILSENEIISLGMRICRQLGLTDARLEINSFGCEACRPAYFTAMREFLAVNRDKYCNECFESLNTNPLDLSSCTDEECLHYHGQSPRVDDFLCAKCRTNFERVRKIQANLGTNFKVNPYLVKNFSYYNETVFNFVIQTNGHTEILGGGGRYDFLSRKVTGKQIPAVGFYLNLDLIFSIMASRKLFQKPLSPFRVYVAAQSEGLELMQLQIVQELHEQGISTIISTDLNTIETDTALAQKDGCQVMVVVRSEPLREGKVMVKNLSRENQSSILLSDLIHELEIIRKSLAQTT